MSIVTFLYGKSMITTPIYGMSVLMSRKLIICWNHLRPRLCHRPRWRSLQPSSNLLIAFEEGRGRLSTAPILWCYHCYYSAYGFCDYVNKAVYMWQTARRQLSLAAVMTLGILWNTKYLITGVLKRAACACHAYITQLAYCLSHSIRKKTLKNRDFGLKVTAENEMQLLLFSLISCVSSYAIVCTWL